MRRQFVSKEEFIALRAKRVVVFQARIADARTVTNNSKFVLWVIISAMLAKAVVFVQAVFADVNELAVAINNVESLITRLFALLTKFVFVTVAIGAVET